uniref:Putative F-box protein n=1 Tax=Noccaea caerulescens TaxID=107243 RepID=A0A1J3IE12_NOCCA
MASSFSPASNEHVPPVTKDKESSNWADLPAELTFSILIRIGTVDILKNAQRVCRSWRRVSKDPLMWRKIEIRSRGITDYEYDCLCRQAVDRSEGGLFELDISDFVGDDSLLAYIADRAGYLRCLKLTASPPVTPKGLVNAVIKLQFLEHVEISHSFLQLDLKPVGCCCPLLKTLKLSRNRCCWGFESDSEALTIAETMPQLRRLELYGNCLTNTGLNAILENCICLQHFDLRDCPFVNLVGGS